MELSSLHGLYPCTQGHKESPQPEKAMLDFVSLVSCFGELKKSFTFVARTSVTQQTTRLTVHLSKDKKVSQITSRKLPEARKCNVINTCSMADSE